MFDFFRRHTRVLQFVLVLLVFPSFLFFGIQGYSRFSSGDQRAVAKVDGSSITTAEFDANLRERIEQARRQMPGLDAKLFDTPEMRSLALDAMVRDRVLLVAAGKLHLQTTDERLDRLFKSDPQFAQLRNPDGSLNQAALAGLGLTSEGFAARLREDLDRRQVTQPIAESALAPGAAASAALDAMYQQRDVQVVRYDTKDYLAKVQPTDAQIEAWFKDPTHAAELRAPEEATVEYVVLDLDGLKKGVTVADDDLRKYYQENEKRYTTPEERHARHILVKADKDAPGAERDKARAKAETLLADVKKNPGRFAEIAKANSDDEGSAAKGGDLDWFGRGAMVKPFEDAAFSLKAGETSGIVESDFGFHIIQVEGARGGEKKSFEAARPELEGEVRSQLASQAFSKAAVEFGDTVYEQYESLAPVATKWKLPVEKVEHVTRTPAPGAKGPLASPKFLEALFAADVLKDKRNTKAIDIGANQIVSGRVVRYTPARSRPLADVRDQIKATLATEQATMTARKLGTEKLAAAKAAPQTPLADATLVVSRMQTRELPRPLVDAILKAPAQSLPAFVGVDLGGQGYAVAKVTKLAGRDPGASDATKASEQYARIWGAAETEAYVAALKARYKATVVGVPVPASPDVDASGASR